jgi:hypothetical protein
VPLHAERCILLGHACAVVHDANARDSACLDLDVHSLCARVDGVLE